ncbi:hypothetical protein [Streptomyces murinus]|uniref:hypothetical protein n=1 Tax=Streptomyces murinus TaxID=33900 RepID=UPI00380E5AD9
MGRPDKAARAAIARRRSDAIDLRLADVDWLTIARKLAADPAANSDGTACPQGHGLERYRKSQEPPSDEALIHAACRDVRTALADQHAEPTPRHGCTRRLLATPGRQTARGDRQIRGQPSYAQHRGGPGEVQAGHP